jgi:hypothetical protein
MLTSALDQYQQQQRITAQAIREVRKVDTRGSSAVARVVTSYQLASASLTFESTPAVLAEQGIDAPTVGSASLSSLLTGPAAVEMLDAAADQAAMERLVATLLLDASRTAGAVDLGRRPAIAGYVRSLNPPSCGRCAVLAGRVYLASQGFLRHPHCDCLMTPTTEAIGKDLVTDPTDLVERGLIHGLSQGDLEALKAGADLGQVVNVRRKQAGLTVGSSVVERDGRPTPQGILRLASDRVQAVELLRRYGYIS